MNKETEINTPDRKFCTGCGAPIPADAPHGICPKCLADGAVETIPAERSSGLPRLEPPSAPELDSLLPDYEVVEEIGRGAMGAVYKAKQTRLNRTVAIKVLPADIAADPAFVERFTREAHALASLTHPHIVTIHDIGSTDGICYIVMEYIEGANLRSVLKAGRLSPKEALAIVVQLCEALQYAHDAGLVHRDIKPENILLTENGSVKIADFGLVKLVGGTGNEATLTATNQTMGTLRYMAPEQLEGLPDADHRADIFSLGVVFYELLTGDVPAGRFAPPSKKVEVDVRLDEVVLRTLDQNPDLRYQHAAEIKTEVESISSHPAPTPAPDTATEKTPSTKPNAPDVESISQVLSGAAISLSLVGVVLLLTSLWLALQVSAHGGGLPGYAIVPMAIAGSIVVIVQGLRMIGLRSYGGAVGAAVFSVVFGLFLGVIWNPGFLLCIIPGIWTLILLNRPKVQAAFLAVARKRIDLPWDGKVHFSKTAIGGALWALMFFAALFSLLTLQSPVTTQLGSASGISHSGNSAVEVTEVNQEPRGLIMKSSGSTAKTSEERSAARKARDEYKTQRMLMTLFVGLPGFSAPFGATILGLIALSQIRHSKGRIAGLPLALADALLFPVLLMNCLIFYFFYLLCIQGSKWIGSANASGPANTPWILIALLTLVGCVVADWLVIRRAWRAVKKPLS